MRGTINLHSARVHQTFENHSSISVVQRYSEWIQKGCPLSVYIYLYSSPYQVIWASNTEGQVIHELLIWVCLGPLHYQKVLLQVSKETGPVSKACPSRLRNVCNGWSSGSRKTLFLIGLSCGSAVSNLIWKCLSWAVACNILSLWVRIVFLSERVRLPWYCSQLHPAIFHIVKGIYLGYERAGKGWLPTVWQNADVESPVIWSHCIKTLFLWF